MPAVTAAKLEKGHHVIQHDNSVKIVESVECVKPECLAETFVRYTDGTTDQFCDFKNIVVQSTIPNYPRKAK